MQGEYMDIWEFRFVIDVSICNISAMSREAYAQNINREIPKMKPGNKHGKIRLHDHIKKKI